MNRIESWRRTGPNIEDSQSGLPNRQMTGGQESFEDLRDPAVAIRQMLHKVSQRLVNGAKRKRIAGYSRRSECACDRVG